MVWEVFCKIKVWHVFYNLKNFLLEEQELFIINIKAADDQMM